MRDTWKRRLRAFEAAHLQRRVAEAAQHYGLSPEDILKAAQSCGMHVETFLEGAEQFFAMPLDERLAAFDEVLTPVLRAEGFTDADIAAMREMAPAAAGPRGLRVPGVHRETIT